MKKWDEDFDDVPLHSKILDELYQGGTDDEATVYRGNKRLPTVGDPRPFDSVVSLCAYTLPVGWLVKEMRFAFPDGSLEPWTVKEIEAIADWVYAQWKAGDRVLIRCQAGMNRSSLVTALVLMKDGLSAAEAIALIRKQRSEYCFSNKHFVEYLQNRGEDDNKTSSTD
ncbi:PTP-IVa domain containing protein [Candidatus Nanopelagicaceae bacterium]